MIATLVASFCNLRSPDRPALGVFHFPEPDKPMLLVPTEPLAGITGITGLAADNRYIYAVGQVPFDENGTAEQAPLSKLLTFDRRDLSLLDSYTFRLGRDVHSLALVDGELIAVSTGTDALVELAVRDGRVVGEHVHWRADPIGEDKDLVHLNAVAVQRGGHADGHGALLVSGFGRRTGQSWNTARKGFIRMVGVWDGAPGPLLAADLIHPHSVLVDGQDVLLCTSYDRTVRTLAGEWITGLPGYARGLCRAGETVYVGTSVGRRRSRSEACRTIPFGNPEDAGRPTGDCAVVGIDRSTGQPVSRVILTQVVKEIYDLLYLDPPATPASNHWRVEKLAIDAAWGRSAEAPAAVGCCCPATTSMARSSTRGPQSGPPPARATGAGMSSAAMNGPPARPGRPPHTGPALLHRLPRDPVTASRPTGSCDAAAALFAAVPAAKRAQLLPEPGL